MFWVILLVIVVVGFVAWKLRVPLLAKILGQYRVAHRPPAQPPEVSRAVGRARRDHRSPRQASSPGFDSPDTARKLSRGLAQPAFAHAARSSSRAGLLSSVDVFLGAHLLELLRGAVGPLVDLAGERGALGVEQEVRRDAADAGTR